MTHTLSWHVQLQWNISNRLVATIVCNEHVKHSVTNIFVCEHAVQFNTENCLCGNLHEGGITQKSVTGNLEYGFPVFQFLTAGK